MAMLVTHTNLSSTVAHASDRVSGQSLPRIAAWTQVGSQNASRWNRVLLLAKPRVATGDIDQLNESIRKASTAFSLTLLASVQEYAATDGSPRYYLADVGVGYSAPIEGNQTVVS